ncbi:hypothetical protein AAFN85_16410 [Mucilaginibacter sp. CAU 1740]|uniref:hypothetical protein n=1 Tax=Mucilaginibacter sp. CAU 1740 TaxID=3140365 RepID=UPI00325A8793
MKVFKDKLNKHQSGIGIRIGQRITKVQRVIADKLNRETQHWNNASKWLMLAVICLLFGGGSLWLLILAWY